MIYEKKIFLKKLEDATPVIQSDISTSVIPLLSGHLIKCKAPTKSNIWACKSKAGSQEKLPVSLVLPRLGDVPSKGAPFGGQEAHVTCNRSLLCGRRWALRKGV